MSVSVQVARMTWIGRATPYEHDVASTHPGNYPPGKMIRAVLGARAGGYNSSAGSEIWPC